MFCNFSGKVFQNSWKTNTNQKKRDYGQFPQFYPNDSTLWQVWVLRALPSQGLQNIYGIIIQPDTAIFFNWKTFSRKCISMKFETCPVTVSFKKCNLLLTIAGQDWIRVKLHIILFWFPPYYFLFGQGWTTRLTDKGHTQSWVSFTYKNRRKLNTTLN